jgi:hypothetical protein
MIAKQNGPCYVHITDGTNLAPGIFKRLSCKRFPKTEFETIATITRLIIPSNVNNHKLVVKAAQ